MDLGVASQNNRPSKINKQLFNLNSSRKDGLVLQVHHTVPASNGEIHRVRFVHIAFDDSGEQLAAGDHRGNIFIIDLLSNKFWMLPNLDSPCTVIGFTTSRKNEILVGINNSSLNFINTELGQVTGSLIGHTVPPTQISFSSDHHYCISASSEESIIWDLKSNSQAHRLAMRAGVAVKKVVFMPVSNNILACFQDDVMHVWKFETFECLKQIVPQAWKSHNLKSMAFTKDGRAMVIGGHTSSLVVFALDNWSVKRVIDLSDTMPGVRSIDFLPQVFDGGANKFLCLLSTNRTTLHFIDIETSTMMPQRIEPESTITKFACSSNGKYIASMLHSGEVNIYNSATLLEAKHHCGDFQFTTETAESVKLHPCADQLENGEATKPIPVRHKRHSTQKHSQLVRNQIRETLDLHRLKPILKEFGEYPSSYRFLIWKTILLLPQNQQTYVGLVNRGCHPLYLQLEENYPLENKTMLKNLKRLLSCLANWSPLFGEVKYLPLFVFPFVKVFQNDPFVCFEAVTTIIVNWCQHWFEYFPYPPINVLAMIENVLAQEDPELIEHFYVTGITSQLYAWTLLENALSEVLSQAEWLRLWDHILSNEPSFLLMVVVSYNIISRSALKLCHTLEELEFFFHNQNAIDMKQLISKSYLLCKQTKEDIHPRVYLKDFSPLEKGIYPVFNHYPRYIVDYQAQEMDAIRLEEETILKEEQLAMEIKVAQEKRIREELQADVEASRIQKLEEVYRDKLQQEELRVAQKRQRVTALRRDLRSREVELMDLAKDKVTRQQARQRTITLDRLVTDIKRKQIQQDCELAATEEEMSRHYADLLTHKHELEHQLGTAEDAVPEETVQHRALQRQQEKLSREMQKLRDEASSDHHSRKMNISTRISKVDEMMQRVELELAREMADRQVNYNAGHSNLKVMQLENQTKALEMEVERLLEQLAETRLAEAKAKMETLALSQTDRWQLNRDQQNLARDQYSEIHSKQAFQHHPRYIHETCETHCNGRGDGGLMHKDLHNQQSSAQLSGTERGACNNCWQSRHSSHRNSCVASPRSPNSARFHKDVSARSREHYSRERIAVQSSMNVREQLLSMEQGSPACSCRK